MNRFLFTTIFSFLFSSSLFSGVEQSYPTRELINSGIKIIDIRTESEWRQSGVLSGVYPITFFYDDGSYNVRLFLRQLNSVVEKGEKFALICRSGSRTKTVSRFLGQNGYNVVNLVGGMNYATKKVGIQPVKYLPNKGYIQ
ncbi:Rhodanese-related sulfurtransferase [Thiovulum sp. ES]|nr:Rhodanese-related sulfurtransferase [Thiovulum sp. ES]